MKTITSRDNAFVKQLIALAGSSRERRKQSLTVLDGIHLVRAYMEALGPPHSLAVAESAMARNEVRELVSNCPSATINVLADNLMAAASGLESPAFMMAMVSTPESQPTPADASILLLEDIQDPGNVGSLLRTAAAAGIREILLSPSTAFAWSPKVLRAAQGAHFLLNIVEGVDVLAFAKAYAGQSLALVAHGDGVQDLFEIDMTGPTAIMVGNEGAGLSPELVSAATHRVTIPMPGKVESLNAAAAGAICLFERVRQTSGRPARGEKNTNTQRGTT
ncbi:MAG: RNA methyltransferase [Betaproteobacteria bacterium]